MASRALLRVLALLAVSALCPLSADAGGEFSPVIVTKPFASVYGSLGFEWAGALWLAGGRAGSSISAAVYGSYDFGRTWTLNPKALPGACVTGATNPRGVLYYGRVYLVCGVGGRAHGSGGQSGYDELTYYSDVADLSRWTIIRDGCLGCSGFSVERMAVPFDGVGTLVMVNPFGSLYPQDVWWQSATGNFQPTSPTSMNTWTPFQQGTDYYSAPWSQPQRQFSATTTDAEGLVLVLAGGAAAPNNDPLYNDVWQLSWLSASLNPRVYRLTANAQWAPRNGPLMFLVNDWLFIYGGSSGATLNDDMWRSGDYGVTWTQFDAAATGKGRYYSVGVVAGRRLFVLGGYDGQSPITDVNTAEW